MSSPRTTIDTNAFASPHRTEAERAFLKRDPSYWSAKGEEGEAKEPNPYVHPAALPRETAIKEVGRSRHVGPRPKPLEVDEDELKPLPSATAEGTTESLGGAPSRSNDGASPGSSVHGAAGELLAGTLPAAPRAPDWASAHGYDPATDARIRGLAPAKRRAYTRRFVCELPVGLVDALAKASDDRGFSMKDLIIRALWEIGIREEP